MEVMNRMTWYYLLEFQDDGIIISESIVTLGISSWKKGKILHEPQLKLTLFI